MKEQSNIEKTVSRSQFCSVNNLSLLSPTHVKPINKLCLSPSWKAFGWAFQGLLNPFIQGHRPFAMQAELGVVRLQQRICMTAKSSHSNFSERKIQTSTSIARVDFVLNPIRKIQLKSFLEK